MNENNTIRAVYDHRKREVLVAKTSRILGVEKDEKLPYRRILDLIKSGKRISIENKGLDRCIEAVLINREEGFERIIVSKSYPDATLERENLIRERFENYLNKGYRINLRSKK